MARSPCFAAGQPGPMLIHHLGQLPYRAAWAAQEQAHAAVLAGGEEQLLLVEHPPVITFGRRPNATRNLIASQDQLDHLGVEVVQSDRGGDITFHGPGQLVAYPIIQLSRHNLSVGAYVRRLLQTVIATLASFAITGEIDPSAIGVWVHHAGQFRKICALGVRIRRGVSMHGVALNVTTDLRFFNLIVPCGIGRPVTSMEELLAERVPPIQAVSTEFVRQTELAFTSP